MQISHGCVTSLLAQKYWVDDLNPWVFQITSQLGLRWYNLAYILGILSGAVMFRLWIRRGRLKLALSLLPSLFCYAGVGVILGARFGYFILYQMRDLITQPVLTLDVLRGGMSSHGGICGLLMALWVFSKEHRIDFVSILDPAVVAGSIGVVFGRLGNFINGELWGRPSLVPWAVIFPHAPLIDGTNVPRHPSQLYAAMLEGVVVFLAGTYSYSRNLKRGSTFAIVCITYGIGRFIDEFWREPDWDQSVYFGWLTKGQLYTIPILVVGIVILWLHGKQQQERRLSMIVE